MTLALAHGIDRLTGTNLQLFDHGLHLLRRLLGAVRQVAHFVGDHGETTARLTGARRFDGSVERQQVGLLGNAGDHFEDLTDVHGLAVERLDVRAGSDDQVGQTVHRFDVACHHLLPFLGQQARGSGVLGSLGSIAGDFLGSGAQFVDGSRHAVGAVGLLVGVGHRRVRGADHAQGHFVDMLGGRGHFADRAVDALDEAVEGCAEDAELVVVVNDQAFGQVAFAFGDVFHGAGHGEQGLHQHADQQAEQADDDHHRDDRGDHRRGAEGAEHGEGFVLVHRQADVPVGRWQALDRGEGQQAGLAVGLDFRQFTRQFRRVLREQVRQRFHHQVLFRMHQDLALVVDQERVAHAAEVQRVDDLHQTVEGQVATDHADTAGHLADDADHHTVGGHVDVRLGKDRSRGVHAVLVPGTGARIVAIGHAGVRANAETTVGSAQIDGQEAGSQRILAEQGIGLGRVQGNVLRQVFHQLDAAFEQVANIGRSGIAHFSQIVLQIVADRITLEIVVVKGEQAEGEHHDQ
ncbi:hypothetical protein D3C81_1113130 [compost metagenome]